MSYSQPSIFFNYYRPWNENASLIDSWLDYNKDISLNNHLSNNINSIVSSYSDQHKELITRLGNQINNSAFEIISGMKEIDSSINILNNKIDNLIQTQLATNVLLEDIAELLKIPDIEKLRLHKIKTGLKYLKGAKRDEDLYLDAYNEFIAAEEIVPQDYFTLFNIGMILLNYSKKINVELALKYFEKTVKYAFTDIDSSEYYEVNNLFISVTGEVNDSNEFNDLTTPPSFISYCYLQIAFCHYILGNDKEAFDTALEATKLLDDYEEECYQAYFFCVKYASRLKDTNNAKKYISIAIKYDSRYLTLFLNDLDIISNEIILEYLEKFINKTNDEFLNLKKDLPLYADFKIHTTLKKSVSNAEKSIEKKIDLIKRFSPQYIKTLIDSEEDNKKKFESIKEEIDSLKSSKSLYELEIKKMEENILFKLKNTTYNDFAKSLIYYLIIFNCFIEVLLMLFVYSDAFTPDEHNRYVIYLTLSTICLILLLFAYHKDKIKNTNLENVHYENKEKIKKIQSRIYELNKKLEEIEV
jgi:hypothetical protein